MNSHVEIEENNKEIKIAIFWGVASLVDIDKRFRKAFCLHHHVDEGSY
jgi:hypothetical protein